MADNTDKPEAPPRASGTSSFTMAMDERMKGDVEAISRMLGTSKKSETLRRTVHAMRLLLEADKTQNASIVVLDSKGRKREVIV